MANRWRHVLDAYGLEGEHRGQIVDAANAKIQRCIGDIVRQAEHGSIRHQILQARGDHHDLEATLAWLTHNRTALTAAIV